MNSSPGNDPLIPEINEPIGSFVMRLCRHRKLVFPSANSLRDTNVFYEVITSSRNLSDEVEEWVWENAGEGMYYYTIEGVGLNFSPVSPAVHWFFNSKDVAAMFKLAFGE